MSIKYLKYIAEFQITLLIYSVLLTDFANAQGFHVGVRGTSCSLDSASYNDPCGSLYEGVCDGAHCKCPPGTHEDQTLKRCAAGTTKKGSTKTGGGGGDLFDLPLDYVPGDKPKERPKPEEKDHRTPPQPGEKQPSIPVQPLPQPAQPIPPSRPAQPRPPAEPQGPSQDDPHIGEKTGGGIGGGIALVVLVGLTYYCCKGEKGKAFMSKLPFIKSRQTEPGGPNYDLEQQVQQQQSLQDPNTPPPAGWSVRKA